MRIIYYATVQTQFSVLAGLLISNAYRLQDVSVTSDNQQLDRAATSTLNMSHNY